MKHAVVGFGIVLCLLICSSSAAAAAPNHTRVIFENSLSQAFENDFAALENHNGDFTGDGWQSTQHGFEDGSKLIVRIKNRLPQTGTIEWKVSNFNPYTQTDFSKQHLVFMSNTQDQDDMFYNGGSWLYLRTGQNYRNADGSCSMKIDVGARGVETRVEEHILSNKFWDINHVYHFKIIYTTSQLWFYLDGELIKTVSFSAQQKRFNQISFGGDGDYPSIVGPVFSDLKISTDEKATFFIDQTRSKNLVGLDAPDFGAHGIAVGDVNGDGLLDIYMGNCLQGNCLRDILYMQQPDGTFVDETEERGVMDECCSHAVIFFDADNDGDLDLFNANTWEPNQLYINDGAGYFSEESFARGIENIAGETRGAVVFDVNNDGWLDIFAVNWGMKNEMYINDGTGHFVREYRGAEGAVEDPEVIGTQGVTVADIDNDGDFDIYISKRDHVNELYVNENGYFTEAAAAHGVAVPKRSDGATFSDFDNDGDMDLFVSNTRQPHDDAPLYQIILENDGRGFFTDRTDFYKLSMEGFTTQLFDANNDGYLDLYRLTNIDDGVPGVAVLSLGDGQGGFESAGYNGAAVIGLDARACAVSDFDNDGDQDIIITAKLFENIVLENRSEIMGNYLQVFLYGPKGDIGGVGSKIDVYEAGHLGDENYLLGHREVVTAVGYLSNSGLAQHFGLDDRMSCDLRITFVDGSVQELRDVQANQQIVVGQPQSKVYHLVKIAGDNQNGVVGEPLPQNIVVRVLDQEGLSSSNVEVTFKANDGGLANGASEAVVQSDAAGEASVTWRLGHQAGPQSLLVRIDDDSTLFFATAAAGDPHTIVKNGGDGQALTPGVQFPQPFSVLVHDAFGNPVANAPVQFQVTAGDGSLNGQKQQSTATDGDGMASVFWTPDAYLGPTNRLEAAASFNDPLQGSPVIWTYDGVEVDGVLSTVSATSPVPADGDSASHIVVTLKNSRGEPVGAGLTVAVNASGSGNKITMPDSLTDADGQVHAWLSSTVDESKKIRATVLGLGLELMQQPTVEFLPAHQQAAKIIKKSGDGQSGVVAMPLPQPFVVQVLDEASAPVANHPVTFSLLSGKGDFDGADSATVQTDADGLASVIFTLGRRANVTSTVQARAADVDEPVVFTVHSLPGEPKKLTILSGNNQIGLPHSTLPLPLAVSVKDLYDNAVAGFAVLFRVNLGDCLVNGASQTIVAADSNGVAAATATLGAKMGESIVEAKAGQMSVTFILTTTDDADIVLVSGDGQSGVVGKKCAAPLVVKLLYNDAPLGDRYVRFTVPMGGGHFNGQDTLLIKTGVDGLASADYFLGTVAGENVVKVSPLAAPDKYVLFTLRGRADVASTLEKSDGDNQTAPVRSRLNRNLAATARDEYGNVVPGATVLFTAVDGGLVVTPQPVAADSFGRAEATVELGDHSGDYTFRAELPSGVFVLFSATATVANHPPEIVSYVPVEDRIKYSYGEHLRFEILDAFDRDGDDLNYSWRFNNALVGLDSSLELFMTPSFPPVDTMRCIVSDGVDSVIIKWTLIYDPASSVKLSFFRAEVVGQSVQLQWALESQSDNAGFRLLRAPRENGPYRALYDGLLSTNDERQNTFSFLDAAPPGRYYYKLESVSKTGRTQEFGPISATVQTPERLALHQNYPNPFNPTTAITFELPKADHVWLQIYNTNGRLVRTMLDADETAGRHTIVWDGLDDAGEKAPSGVYFYKLVVSGQTLVKKLTMMK